MPVQLWKISKSICRFSPVIMERRVAMKKLEVYEIPDMEVFCLDTADTIRTSDDGPVEGEPDPLNW